MLHAEKDDSLASISSELRRQRLVLTAILAVNLLVPLMFAASAGIVLYNLKKAGDPRRFTDKAEGLYLRGEIIRLGALSQDRASSHPNDAWAYWYLAKVALHQQDWSTAQGHFHRALELDPSWSDSVGPYLEQIQAPQSGTPPPAPNQ